MSTSNFQATIVSLGYHVYKETTWSNAKVNEKVKIDTNTLIQQEVACIVIDDD